MRRKAEAKGGSRDVYLMGEINDENIRETGRNILKLFQEDRRKLISLMLCSYGGKVAPAIAFWELMRLRKVPLKITVLGEAHSAAIIVLCAGIQRHATENSIFFFHPMSREIRERLEERDFENQLTIIRHMDRVSNGIIARTVGQPIKKIDALDASKRFLTAEEAKALGLIQDIISIP